MQFSISHADPASFKPDGLRTYFEYRDLGIKDATGGQAVMHLITSSP